MITSTIIFLCKGQQEARHILCCLEVDAKQLNLDIIETKQGPILSGIADMLLPGRFMGEGFYCSITHRSKGPHTVLAITDRR